VSHRRAITQQAPSFNGRSLALDGATGFASTAATVGSTGDLTVAFWAYPNSATAVQQILSSQESVAGLQNWHIYMQAGTASKIVTVGWGNGTNYNLHTSGANAIASHVWRHIIWTRRWTGTEWKSSWYVNGAMSGAEATRPYGSIKAATALWVGRTNYPVFGSFFWGGRLDEIALWGAYADTDAVAEIYNGGATHDLTAVSLASMLAYWRWEQDGTDSSGNGATATLTGGATYSTDVP